MMKRIKCWLRLGHDWRFHEGGDERRCKRCGLWQYATVETVDGEKTWSTE